MNYIPEYIEILFYVRLLNVYMLIWTLTNINNLTILNRVK